MTATQADIARLRRMIAEPTELTYLNADLANLIESRPTIDSNGRYPDDASWVPTYDLFLVASEIWMEKASAVSDEFDFHADGGTFQREQKHKMALKQASYYQSRSKADNLKMRQEPASSRKTDFYYKDDIDDYESSLV